MVLLPPRPPHPNFWWGLFWCIAFLLVQIGVQIAGTLVGFVVQMASDPTLLKRIQAAGKGRGAAREVERLLTSGGALTFGMICQEVTAVLMALLVLRVFVGGQWRRRVAFVRPRTVHVVLAVLAMPGMLVLENLVHHSAGRFLPTFEYQEMVEKTIAMFSVPLALALFSVSPGISEELLFRGFIGRGLLARHGWIVGVAMTSFLFGLAHLDPPHVLATAVMGVVLHYVYITGRSLLLPILMHMLNNGLAVLVAKKVPPFDTIDEPDPANMIVVTVTGIALLAAVCWALYDSRVRVEQESPDGWLPAFPGVEYPPPGTASRARRKRPSWLSGIGVVLALSAFVAAIWLS